MALQIDYDKYPSLRVPIDEDFVESHDGRERRLLDYLKAHPDNSNFRGDSATLLAAIDEYAAKKEFLINIGPDKARIITDMIIEKRPSVVIEVGAYVGYSAIVLGEAMKRGSPNDAASGKLKLYSLELEEDFAAIVREVVAFAGLGDIVEVIAGEAGETLKKLVESAKVMRGGVDFVLLDHVEDLYEEELKGMVELGLFRKGSLVAADNVLRPGAPAYRAFIRADDKWDSKAVKGLIIPGEFEDELEVSRFK